MKKDNNKVYPYRIKFNDRSCIFLWEEGTGNRRDHFIISSDDRLWTVNTSVAERTYLDSHPNAVIYWNEIAELDVNEFFVRLQRLKPGHAATIRTCTELLNGWNALEDFAATFQIESDLPILRNKLLAKAYDKIFHGVNIPAVTPKGRSYSPLFFQEEILKLRTALTELWRLVQQRVPEFKELR